MASNPLKLRDFSIYLLRSVERIGSGVIVAITMAIRRFIKPKKYIFLCVSCLKETVPSSIIATVFYEYIFPKKSFLSQRAS